MSRPTFIPPMAAQSVTELPEGPEWVYEVKFDGYRALLLKSGAGIELRSRNNKDLTNAYPSVLAAGRKLRADSLVLDGEVVALDASGRPSFQALQHRSAHPKHAIVYYAFDLLQLEGEELTSRPLVTRRAKLEPLVKGSGILLSETLDGSAAHVIEAVRALGLEGIVAKRKDSRYVPGERNSVVAEAETRSAAGVRGRRLSARQQWRRCPAGRLLRGQALRFARQGARGIHAAYSPAGIRRNSSRSHGRSARSSTSPAARRPTGAAASPPSRWRDAVGQTEAGGADPVRRVDRRRPPAARGLPRLAHRQASERGSARSRAIGARSPRRTA